MIYEDLRAIHEDVERLEQAIADRVGEDPKHVSIHPVTDTLPQRDLQLTDPQSTHPRPRNLKLP